MKCQSTKGVITTPHPLSTKVGLRILAEGGTAIDAMIAASATLAAVFPHMTGIGGDAVWVLYDKKVSSIMGIGQAGQRAPLRPITERGPDAVATTAGAIASWQAAIDISTHQWGSDLSLQRLLKDAISYAEQGTQVSASQAFWIKQRQALLTNLPDLNPIVRRADGQPLQVGDTFKQQQLARTLKLLSKNGLMDFYQGEVAEALHAGFTALNGNLSLDDLRKTRARNAEMVKVRYRAGDYYNFPAPSQGIYTAKALTTLNQWDLGEHGMGSAQSYHLMVEAIKQSFTARNIALCDPDFSPLNSLEIASTASLLDATRASPWGEQGQPADTVWLAATDSDGRTACLMQSLFHDFGSGCMIGDTGVLWHNRAAGFNSNSQHPNAWGISKRPAHTLNPSCYIADNGHRFFFGSQGGDGQPQTQLVLATQLIDFNQDVETALNAPRFLLGRSFFDSTDNLKLEQSLPEAIRTALTELGHITEVIPSLSPYTGQAGIITITPNGMATAMHDPRGEGTALAL